MAQKKRVSGKEKFEEYYFNLYKDRWPTLRESLLKDPNSVSLSDELNEPYYMDEGSVIAANCLPVKEGDKVLDMCAAPGGKTLSIALRLKGNGILISNDRSADRRNRLIKVLQQCLNEKYRSVVKVTGYDSTKWGLYEKEEYDCILLDAPCSSERHVIKSETALSEWGTNRPKVLSIQQFSMICAALEAVKTGGYFLYSTCSINNMENNDVIEKLLKKREGRFEEIDIKTVCPKACELSEPLNHGRIILPDKSNGRGPLYFCLMRRIK